MDCATVDNLSQELHTGYQINIFAVGNVYLVCRLSLIVVQVTSYIMVNGDKLSGTNLIHGDSGVSYFKGAGAAVAPSISVSTSVLLNSFDLGYAGSVLIPLIDWSRSLFQLTGIRLRTTSSMSLRLISGILRDMYTLATPKKRRVVPNTS